MQICAIKHLNFKTMSKNPTIGLAGLLRPEDSIVVLIDHQPYQFTNLNSHEPTMIINNVVGLAKTAKVFKVPTILTTVIEERGGYIIKGLQDVFPEQSAVWFRPVWFRLTGWLLQVSGNVTGPVPILQLVWPASFWNMVEPVLFL